MTGGDDPRERADGWFDIIETTTINGLQALLDSIGTLHARLIADDTGLDGLARKRSQRLNGQHTARYPRRWPPPMQLGAKQCNPPTNG